MKRSMLQVYVKDAEQAIELYKKALDAKLLEIVHSPDGKVFHSELDVHGQILSVAERTDADGSADQTGNIMQFCLHFGEGGEENVRRAYEALSEGAEIRIPLAPNDWSANMTDLVDRFGVRWCIFV